MPFNLFMCSLWGMQLIFYPCGYHGATDGFCSLEAKLSGSVCSTDEPGPAKGCTSMRRLVLPFVATCLPIAQHCLLLPCWIQVNQGVHISRSQMQSMLALGISLFASIHVAKSMLKVLKVHDSWLSIFACRCGSSDWRPEERCQPQLWGVQSQLTQDHVWFPQLDHGVGIKKMWCTWCI